jgi:uncharacterized protein
MEDKPMVDQQSFLAYANECLKDIPHATKRAEPLPFRNRYTHTLRVCGWCERLLERIPADRDVVLAAAALHDIGYAVSAAGHAEHGATMAREHLRRQGYDDPFLDNVSDLIAHHSQKNLPASKMSNELIILQDADCLDEIGAITILWDSLHEGAQTEQGYEKTYRRIQASYDNLTGRGLKLKSEYGNALYMERFDVLQHFLCELRYELFLND